MASVIVKAKSEITAERLREVMTCDPEAGTLQWRVITKGKKPGPVGYLDGSGYLNVGIDYRAYLVARLIWLYVYGRFPVQYIDHKNGIRTDNRLVNLREATPTQNQQNRNKQRNNSLGIKGAYWSKEKKCYRAKIRVDGNSRHLGYFATLSEASDAYEAAASLYFGEFRRSADAI